MPDKIYMSQFLEQKGYSNRLTRSIKSKTLDDIKKNKDNLSFNFVSKFLNDHVNQQDFPSTNDIIKKDIEILNGYSSLITGNIAWMNDILTNISDFANGKKTKDDMSNLLISKSNDFRKIDSDSSLSDNQKKISKIIMNLLRFVVFGGNIRSLLMGLNNVPMDSEPKVQVQSVNLNAKNYKPNSRKRADAKSIQGPSGKNIKVQSGPDSLTKFQTKMNREKFQTAKLLELNIFPDSLGNIVK